MRIIAGEFRGRPLLSPKGETTRPITDRVKQSVFDCLAPLIPGSIVYDCFAGTGSMGLECLSRGADRAIFFEFDLSAAAILRRNITTFKVEKRCEVIVGDIFSILPPSPPGRAANAPANLLFLDPPYRFLRERPADLIKLAHRLAHHHLAPDATVIFRHDLADSLDLPPLTRYDQRNYGSMAVEFLTCPSSS